MELTLGMKTLALASFALVAMNASAQSQGSVAWIYDLKYNESSAVAMTKIGQLHNVLGKGIDLDVSLFAGTNLNQKGKPVGGFVLTKSFPLAIESDGLIGLGANVQEGRPVSLVVTFGASWRF